MEGGTAPAEVKVVYILREVGRLGNPEQEIVTTYFRGLLDGGTIDEAEFGNKKGVEGSDFYVWIKLHGTLPEKVVRTLTDHYHGQLEKP